MTGAPPTSVIVALAVATLVGLALAASPLLGVHGVESALVLGLTLPSFVCPAAASVAARSLGERPLPWVFARGAVGVGGGVWAVPTAILALNSVRVPSCTPAEGLAFVVAGPGLGCLFAGAAGVVLAGWVGRRRAMLLAALLPLLSALLGAWSFWATPAIFVFDHFAGWLPGTLYDRGTRFPASLLTFRAITVAAALGAALVTAAAWDPAAGRARLAALPRRPRPLGLGLALVGAAALATAFGPALGHRASVARIVEELGATARGARCIVHAPREADAAMVDRLVRDCDFRVEQAERRLGLRQPVPIRAFFFRDAAEKQRLMGAGGTLIAKPWRNEVYLQMQGWPHPVLLHEVAHVVAGQIGRGPLRIAGPLGGLVPDQALVEGTAVAVDFRIRNELTPHQWSRALLELERLPSLRSLVGLRFLLRPARDAYTVSGSFLRWLADTRGRDVLRTAYRLGDVARAAGAPLEALEREWRAFLRTVPLPEGALARARLEFDQPSLFATVCPHRVARLERDLGGARASGDLARAVEAASAILEIDPGAVLARAARAEALARLGALAPAERDLAALDGAPAPVVAAAREGLADAAWARGEQAAALAAYEALLTEPMTDDAARALEVKRLGLEAGDPAAELVFALLVEDGDRPVPAALAVHLAHRLDAARADGLGAYLEARQLAFSDAWPEAAARLEAALARGLPTARLDVEARRLLGTARYAAGDLEGAAAVWRALLGAADATPARRLEAEDWLARIRWARRRPPVTAPRAAPTAS